jgi:hypothetical protein
LFGTRAVPLKFFYDHFRHKKAESALKDEQTQGDYPFLAITPTCKIQPGRSINKEVQHGPTLVVKEWVAPTRGVTDGEFNLSRPISCFSSRRDLIAVHPQPEDGLWSREFQRWTG